MTNGPLADTTTPTTSPISLWLTPSATLGQSAVGVPQGAAAPATTGGQPGSVTATQEGQPLPGQTGTPAGGRPPGGDMSFIFIMFGMLALLILLSVFTGRKEKKRRAAMMASLKKQDKVLMSGGIVGIVTDLTDDEIVIRSEEARLRFTRAAVQTILSSRSDALTDRKTDDKAA
jgi:preprotein translocase subunit YajC